jgi:hypothetical protein
MQAAPETLEFTLPFWRKHRGTLVFGALFGGYFSVTLTPAIADVIVGRYQHNGFELVLLLVVLAMVLWTLQQLLRQLRTDFGSRGVDVRVDVAGLQLRDRTGQTHAVGWQDVRYFEPKIGIVNYECSAVPRGWCERKVTTPQMTAAERDRIWTVVRLYWPILDETWQHQLVKRQHLDFAAATLTSGTDP